MNLANIRAELEEALTWRVEELRFHGNQLSALSKESDQDRYRRAMVVILYSHFEGFWKGAFTIYVNAINSSKLRCVDANESLVAASFAEVFHALSDSGRKSVYFRNSAPDDTKLHRFCRHTEFVSRIGEFERETVLIEPDNVVDTESNLKPSVIRKNLFRLGFPHDTFSEFETTIGWLLKSRNQVAHGATRSGLTAVEYEPLELAVMDVMGQRGDSNYLRLVEEP